VRSKHWWSWLQLAPFLVCHTALKGEDDLLQDRMHLGCSTLAWKMSLLDAVHFDADTGSRLHFPYPSDRTSWQILSKGVLSMLGPSHAARLTHSEAGLPTYCLYVANCRLLHAEPGRKHNDVTRHRDGSQGCLRGPLLPQMWGRRLPGVSAKQSGFV
jgi:hypothetical protein